MNGFKKCQIFDKIFKSGFNFRLFNRIIVIKQSNKYWKNGEKIDFFLQQYVVVINLKILENLKKKIRFYEFLKALFNLFLYHSFIFDLTNL